MEPSDSLKALRAISSDQLARLVGIARRLDVDEALLEDAFAASPMPSDSSAADDPSWEVKQIELRIRQLAAQGAPWSQIKIHAWRRFRLDARDESAARLVEAAFLSGSVHETIDTLIALNEEGFEYYFHLESRFREHLTFKLMQAHKTASLNRFLDRSVDVRKLSPIELLLIFNQFESIDERPEKFIFFRQHEVELVEAVSKYGPGLKLSLPRFAIEMATEAIALGFVDVAKRLLKEITPEHSEYADALQLQMLVEFDPNDPAADSYFRRVERAADWRERLSIVSGFIDDCRKRVGGPDIRRPSLNEILADPFQWLPDIAVAISEFSGLLSRNGDLHETLPSMFNLYREWGLKFQTPAMEAAIWKPALTEIYGDHPVLRYWRGVAALHMYVAFADGQESLLWDAKRRTESSQEKWAFVLPYTWQDLHQAATQNVLNSAHIVEHQRLQMMNQLKVAASVHGVSLTDVERYLQGPVNPPYAVLGELQQIAKSKKALTLELQILRKRVEQHHYVTSDLDRAWTLANAINDHDLSWRVATVLEGRQSLDERIASPWAISGEKRSEYPFFVANVSHVELCLSGFSKDEKKLCSAVVVVGPLIPELLASIDSTATMLKMETPAADSFEARAERALDALGWLAQQRKIYRFGSEGILSTNIQLPNFLQIMPNNLWSYLYLRIAERLGLNSWSWKISRLFEALDGMLPRFASSKAQDVTKVGKWLRQLRPEVRSAWQDLAHLKNKISDERCSEVLAIFLARLALILHPAHVQALKSLRTMRAPIYLVWSLEQWMLGEVYSDIRRDLNTLSRSQVPQNIRSMTRISRSKT